MLHTLPSEKPMRIHLWHDTGLQFGSNFHFLKNINYCLQLHDTFTDTHGLKKKEKKKCVIFPTVGMLDIFNKGT